MTPSDIIIRHALIDRIMHWVMAFSVLVLMGTAFLPILGLQFSWVTAHWVTGLVLAIAIIIHMLRSLQWRRLKEMWFGLRDIKDTFATIGWFFKLKGWAPKPGKYSPAQKLIHHGLAVVVLTSVVTGFLITVKVDTPLWERDPYWLSTDSWGVVYVLHGASSLLLITMIMLHIYFVLRPEKRMYLHSMCTGRITKGEFEDYHDPNRWSENNT